MLAHPCKEQSKPASYDSFRKGRTAPPQVALVVKNSPANARLEGDIDLTPESGRSLGAGHGNPLQYSYQGIMDRGAWQATVLGLQIRQHWGDLACIHLPIPWRSSLSGKGSIPRLTLDRPEGHNLWTIRRSPGLTLASHGQLNHPAHLPAPWLLVISPLSIFYLCTALSCLFSHTDFYDVLFLTFLPFFLKLQVHSRPILSTPLLFLSPSSLHWKLALPWGLLFSPTLCDPTPGFPVLRYLPEFAQIHVHWVGDAIQPSHPLLPSFCCFQSFPAWGSFPMCRLFASGGRSARRIAHPQTPESFSR